MTQAPIEGSNQYFYANFIHDAGLNCNFSHTKSFFYVQAIQFAPNLYVATVFCRQSKTNRYANKQRLLEPVIIRGPFGRFLLLGLQGYGQKRLWLSAKAGNGRILKNEQDHAENIQTRFAGSAALGTYIAAGPAA
jgi:hypothetical protein